MYTETQEKKLLLKQFQPPTFKGEGTEVEKLAETWIEQLDDYFNEAGTAQVNRAMFGMFKLAGEAKLWWKQYCKDKGVVPSSQTWEQIKQAIRERYLPLAHETLKMNEFYRLKQFSLSLEEYYSKFVSLRRYAPLMTEEQRIARFCQGLNSPLDSRLEAMRPTSVQDALIREKPLSREISQDRGIRRREPMHSRPQEGQNRRPPP